MALTNSYITVDELVAHLRAGEAGDAGPVFELACDAASRAIDDHCRRRFYLDDSPVARTFVPRHPAVLMLSPDIGDASITVQTDSGDDGTFETTWATTDYQLEPANAIADGVGAHRIVAVGSYWFPQHASGRASVKITAKWGWPAVPKAVKQATMLMAARLVKRADSPLGTYTISDGAAFVSANDKDVAALLRTYRNLGV